MTATRYGRGMYTRPFAVIMLCAAAAGLEGEHPQVAAAMNSVINALLTAGV